MKVPLKARFTLVEVMVVTILMFLLLYVLLQVFVMQRRLYEKAMAGTWANEMVRKITTMLAVDCLEAVEIRFPALLKDMKETTEEKLVTWPQGNNEEKLTKIVLTKQRVIMTQKERLNKAIDVRVTYLLMKEPKGEGPQTYRLRRRIEKYYLSDGASPTEVEIEPRVERDIGEKLLEFVPFRVRALPAKPVDLTSTNPDKPPFQFDDPWHAQGGGSRLLWLRIGAATDSKSKEYGRSIRVFTNFFVQGQKTFRYR